jgi:hypothetical protein
VSDFVLHAAKQNGSAILEGIIRCWYFPVFPSAADQAFRFCGANAVFCPPTLLPWVDSDLFVRRFEVMEALEVVG